MKLKILENNDNLTILLLQVPCWSLGPLSSCIIGWAGPANRQINGTRLGSSHFGGFWLDFSPIGNGCEGMRVDNKLK